MAEPLVFISAGDPSGDNASARLVAELRQLRPGVRLFGLGGPRLKHLGQEQLADSADLAVLGFWEVARRFWFFRELMQRSVDEIRTRRPACVVLVDYPGFNLRLAKRIKSLGIPIIYYISPQLWAWGKGRLEQVRELIDLMIVILPFEQDFYRNHDVRAEFVGHYLLEDIPAEFIGSPIPGSKQIALLPGSRPQEIDRMLPAMLEAARRCRRELGSTAMVAALRNGYDYERHVNAYRADGVGITYDAARRILHESDLALTASGTATLETAIIGRPMVVLYKTGFLTYQIARQLVTIDKIALVNLVLGDKLVPELIQGEANPSRLAEELTRFGREPEYNHRVRERLLQVPALLGGLGASRRAAEMVSAYL